MSRYFMFVYAVVAMVLLGANEARLAVASADQRAALPAELIERHKAYPGCTDPADESMPKGAELGFGARLDETTEVFGILCEPEGYNQPWAIYIVRDGYYADAERQYFADYSLETGWSGSAVLYNAAYDEKAGELRGFSRSTALSDCGSKTTLKWDGNQLVLTEFRFKDQCDGNYEREFPLLYKRTAPLER